jgi:pimeloyl-ACP methyl ester carboxylesterase
MTAPNRAGARPRLGAARLALRPTLFLCLLLLAPLTLAGDAAPWSDETGAGEPTIVLLHGIGADHAIWDQIVPALAARHRVVRVDLPGHGASSPIGAITVANVARAVDRALEARHVERALLVGHSYGGWVALEEAVAKPRRAAGVVVIDMGAYTPPDTARIATLEHHLKERYVSLVQVIFENMSIDPVECDSSVARALRVAPDVLGGYLRDSWRGDMRPRIRDLSVPVHVVATAAAWPESQSWEAARARAGYATRGPVEGHRVTGSGHLVMMDRPDTLAVLIERIADAIGEK